MKEPYLVAIAGPSGTGKSEISKRLQNKLGETELIGLDDYFKDPTVLPRFEQWVNSDVPEALDFKSLYNDLKKLKEGTPVTISILSKPHKSWERSTRLVNATPIILIEGFLVLFDKKVRNLFNLKIFIDIPTEVQIQRRLQRDANHNIEYIKKVVVPNFRKYGLPTKKCADYVIDGNKSLKEVTSKIKEIIEKGYKTYNSP